MLLFFLIFLFLSFVKLWFLAAIYSLAPTRTQWHRPSPLLPLVQRDQGPTLHQRTRGKVGAPAPVAPTKQRRLKQQSYSYAWCRGTGFSWLFGFFLVLIRLLPPKPGEPVAPDRVRCRPAYLWLTFIIPPPATGGAAPDRVRCGAAPAPLVRCHQD